MRDRMELWSTFYGPNLGYINEIYEQYCQDPESIDPSLRQWFDQWGAPPQAYSAAATPAQTAAVQNADIGEWMKKTAACLKLLQTIRTRGHLVAHINPLHDGSVNINASMFSPANYGLTEQDLRNIPAHAIMPAASPHFRTAFDALKRLTKLYTGSIGFEFDHVPDDEERDWLYETVESGEAALTMTIEERLALLKRLTEVESFETFLHRTFAGQKRFSIEGVDALAPMIDKAIELGAQNGTETIVIGMAHRGRLNILSHIKSSEAIFAEFLHAPHRSKDLGDLTELHYGWTGDVKYHLGTERIVEENTRRIRLFLANNPSHLEFVSPVVEGSTRAAQEERKQAGAPRQDYNKAFAILVHGDSAMTGEGIVAETFNLSNIPGYRTGGTIHIIANNQIGFTAEGEEARSTRYSSDLAKGFAVPIVHVNADDPEACLYTVLLAYKYREKYHKDFLIDLIGYRRYGHNETDDPVETQPTLYSLINAHTRVRLRYADALKNAGLITDQEIKQIEQDVLNKLKADYERAKARSGQKADASQMPQFAALPEVQTAVPRQVLREINDSLLQRPRDFSVYPKLERILQRRSTAFEDGGTVDWALAETLAFAAILRDGTPIRITGQDTERGTFAHRHLVLHDAKTGERYNPLQHLPHAKASFAIHNSPVTEAAVLGFEYGYNVMAPETFVLWEAQFGDFANAAQVIIDQFISAGRAKWDQISTLAMLLPHGYEGQGPEHSSARLERFLQLAAENNWIVANVTTAAQYFHILRRQAAIGGKHEARPLVIMTPKSLLRNQQAASPSELLSEGSFRVILEHPELGKKPNQVKRLILCSGKVAVDLETEIAAMDKKPEWLHIVRVEQLYPFPSADIARIIFPFQALHEIVWLQEEPKNMGAWAFVEPRLRALAPRQADIHYIGRPERSSPAEGSAEDHKREQKLILKQALNRDLFKTLQETTKGSGLLV
ncbi:MAG TPA: 2-oxoglutarate dehydrogenase E1 component [Bacilli bacterium]